MAHTVKEVGIQKEPGYLYFVDKNGDVARTPMARRGHEKAGGKEIVAQAGITKEKGYLYFVDKAGNIAAARMLRNGRPRKD